MTTGDRPIDFTRGVPADESFPLAECAAAVRCLFFRRNS